MMGEVRQAFSIKNIRSLVLSRHRGILPILFELYSLCQCPPLFGVLCCDVFHARKLRFGQTDRLGSFKFNCVNKLIGHDNRYFLISFQLQPIQWCQSNFRWSLETQFRLGSFYSKTFPADLSWTNCQQRASCGAVTADLSQTQRNHFNRAH